MRPSLNSTSSTRLRSSKPIERMELELTLFLSMQVLHQ
jgi:hypothetical protein